MFFGSLMILTNIKRMRSLLTTSLIMTIVSLSAQMTPEEVVQKQLDTYND